MVFRYPRKSKRLKKTFQDIFIFLFIFVYLFFNFDFQLNPIRIESNPPKAEASAGQIIMLIDASTTPTGWTCISCVVSDPFFNVMPRASSTYGNASSGADSVYHNLTYSSQTTSSISTTTRNGAASGVPSTAHTHTWANKTSTLTSILPPYVGLRFIEAATTTLPNGAIGMFDVASSSLPANWTYYSTIENDYLRGGVSSSTGGSATHTHGVPSQTSGAATSSLSGAGTGVTVSKDAHKHNISAGTNLASDNNNPPFVTLVFAKLTTTSSVPTGLIAMFDNASLPSNWSIISNASPYLGNLIEGSSTSGATGGSATHNHGGSITITTTANNNSVAIATGTINSTNTAALDGHTHNVTFTIETTSSMPVYRDVILGKYSGSVVGQSSYRWFNEIDSADVSAIDTSVGSSTSFTIEAIATDTSNMYLVGYTPTTWRIEKRLLSSGDLVTTFGTNGAVTGTSTTNKASAVAIDSSWLYIEGSDDSNDLRVEKRSLTTGALDSSFGTSGAVTVTSSTVSLTPSNGFGGIAVNSSSIYVASYDTVNSKGHLNKLSTSTGAVSYDIVLASNYNVDGMAIDATNMYIVGEDDASQFAGIGRIEKRLLSDGSLVTAFDGDGILLGSSTSKTFSGITIDGTSMYVSGQNTSGQGRFEKRSLTTGVGDSSFGTSGVVNASSSSTYFRSIVLDGSGNFYSIGWDSNTVWRIEKRSSTSGVGISAFGTSGVVTSLSNSENGYGLAFDSNYLYAMGVSYTSRGGRIERRNLGDGTIATSSAWGAPLAAANTTATAPTQGTNFHLRLTLHATSGLPMNDQNFKLQFATQSSTCDTSFTNTVSSSYSDVATSSGAIRFGDNLTPTTGDYIATSTNDPTGEGVAVTGETYVEQNNFTSGASTILAGNDGEWDFSLVDYSSAANITYCFRVVNSSGSALNQYDVIPQITTGSSATQTQSGYRWFSNTDSADLTAVRSNISSGVDVANDVVVDSTNSVMYVVGTDINSSDGFAEWHIEKRNLADGSLIFSTSSNPTTVIDTAYAVAIDSSAMYVVGFENGSFGGHRIRIEKRSLTDGSILAVGTSSTSLVDIPNKVAIDPATGYLYLVGQHVYLSPTNYGWEIQRWSSSTLTLDNSFGSSGSILENVSSTGSDVAQSISIDSAGGVFYVGGNDALSGDLEWRIERRQLSDGSLLASSTSNPSSNDDYINSIAYDSVTAALYVVGYDRASGTTNAEWRVEKHTSGTLALQISTTTNPSSGDDIPTAAAVDGTNAVLYMAGYDHVSGDNEWRLEERQLSDLSLSYATTTNPSTNSDLANGLALDAPNGYMYTVGSDEVVSSTDDEWRIDKRNTVDGSLVWGSALAATNTSAVAPAQGTGFRLRLLLHSTSTTGASNSFKLQFAAQSSSCDTAFTQTASTSYADVATSSGAIRFLNNSSTASAVTVVTSTLDPTHGSDSIIPETYQEQNNASATSNITTGQDGLWDFPLVDASAPSSTSYCFRLVNASGSTALAQYNTIPEIKTGGVFNQTAYRWFNGVDSVKVGGIVSNPSSGADGVQAIALDSTNSALYAVGYDTTSTYSTWHIEKRNFSDGSLVYATDTPSSGLVDQANAAVVYGNSLYVGGYYNASIFYAGSQFRIERRSLTDGSLLAVATSTSGTGAVLWAVAVDPATGYVYDAGGDYVSGAWNWRIEKRTSSTLALSTDFNGSGFVTEAVPSSSITFIQSLAIDSSGGYIYVAGYDNAPGNDEWRVEKRNLSNGSLIASTTENSSANDDYINSIAYDSATQAIYLAGVDQASGTTDEAWRIEKRASGTLALDNTFGTSGVIRFNPSANNDEAKSIAVDSANSAIYTTGFDQTNGSGDSEWRIEERGLSSGNFITAPTRNPSSSQDYANTSVFDATGGNLYVGGSEQFLSTSNSAWRIEKFASSSLTRGWNDLAALNTNATLVRANQQFRLRALVRNNGSQVALSGQSFKLQYAAQSGSCDTGFSGETYANVTTSTPVAYYDNTTPADGTALATSTNDPTNGGDTVLRETYEEANNLTNSVNAISTSQDGLWDFSLFDNSAPASTTYCMRIIKSDGSVLDNYTVIPTITTKDVPSAPGTPTFGSITTSSLTVSWTAATNADYYRIEQSTGSFSEIGTTTALSYNVSGLTASTSYQYRIRATNDKGNGPYGGTGIVRTFSGYAPTGTLISLIIDTAVTNGVAPNSIYWEGTLPALTSVKFQFAAATSTAGPWNYTAWNSSNNSCDPSSYYDPGAPLAPVEIKALCQNNLRYIRYLVYISSSDTNVSPQVDRIVLNYAQ